MFQKGNRHGFKPGQSGFAGRKHFRKRLASLIRKRGADKVAAEMLINGLTRFVIEPPADDNEVEAARRKREHPDAPKAIYVRTVAAWLAVAEYVIGKPLPGDADESSEPRTLLEYMAELEPAAVAWKKEQAGA